MEDHEFSIFCPQTEQYKMVFKTSIFACHFFQDIFSCFHCLLKKKKKAYSTNVKHTFKRSLENIYQMYMLPSMEQKC